MVQSSFDMYIGAIKRVSSEKLDPLYSESANLNVTIRIAKEKYNDALAIVNQKCASLGEQNLRNSQKQEVLPSQEDSQLIQQLLQIIIKLQTQINEILIQRGLTK